MLSLGKPTLAVGSLDVSSGQRTFKTSLGLPWNIFVDLVIDILRLHFTEIFDVNLTSYANRPRPIEKTCWILISNKSQVTSADELQDICNSAVYIFIFWLLQSNGWPWITVQINTEVGTYTCRLESNTLVLPIFEKGKVRIFDAVWSWLR